MNLRSILLAGMAAVFCAQPANAQGSGWYLGLGAGWSTLDPVKFNVAPPLGPLDGNITFEDAASVYLAAGYRFDPPIRVELQVNYADFGSSQLRIGSGTAVSSGDVGVTSFMVNGLYDIPLSRHFSLSLGAGVGAALVDASLHDPLGDRLDRSATARGRGCDRREKYRHGQSPGDGTHRHDGFRHLQPSPLRAPRHVGED
jgi:opacity protein-like surface antigen